MYNIFQTVPVVWSIGLGREAIFPGIERFFLKLNSVALKELWKGDRNSETTELWKKGRNLTISEQWVKDGDSGITDDGKRELEGAIKENPYFGD